MEYKYHYHKTVHQVLRIQKEYLEEHVKGLDKDMAKHILAGMILHMEARGYKFTTKFKEEMVGKNYDWHNNIV